MSRVEFSAEAAADLDEIWFRIAQDSPERADRMLDRIHEVAHMTLAPHPEAGRAREELGLGLRSFAVKNYLLFYTVADGGIDIVRVLHGARDLPHLLSGGEREEDSG
jgi:toxin ParE1/3/4